MRRAPGIELHKYLETQASLSEKDDLIVLMKAIIIAYMIQIYANHLSRNDLNLVNIMLDWPNVKDDNPIQTIVAFTNARKRGKKIYPCKQFKNLLKQVWLCNYSSEQRQILELDSNHYGTNDYEFACHSGYIEDKSDEVIRIIYKNKSFNVSKILADFSSYQLKIKNKTYLQQNMFIND